MIHFILYMLTGAIAGTLAGIFGIGGGIIVIPGLVWIFAYQNIPNHLIMHVAAGTSLAAMVLTAISSTYGHVSRGAEVWPVYRRLFIGLIVGTISGAIFGHLLPNRVLELLFALFVLFVSGRMILALKSKPSRTLPGPIGIGIVAFIIGLKSGILGIGGGALIIPFLIFCNAPVRNSVAISAACSLTIAIIGATTYMLTGSHVGDLPAFSTGYVYWPAFLGLVLTAPLCAQIGAYFSHRLPVNTLKRFLGVVLLVVAIKMFI